MFSAESIQHIGITTVIALIYNTFFHKLANVMYKDMIFEERKQNSITVLFVAGIMGIVIGYILTSTDFEYSNDSVGLGLKIGGFFVLASSVLNNWTEMDDNLKLFLLGGSIIGVIYYSYRQFR